jgi:hypothetical protein
MLPGREESCYPFYNKLLKATFPAGGKGTARRGEITKRMRKHEKDAHGMGEVKTQTQQTMEWEANMFSSS